MRPDRTWVTQSTGIGASKALAAMSGFERAKTVRQVLRYILSTQLCRTDRRRAQPAKNRDALLRAAGLGNGETGGTGEDGESTLENPGLIDTAPVVNSSWMVDVSRLDIV